MKISINLVLIVLCNTLNAELIVDIIEKMESTLRPKDISNKMTMILSNSKGKIQNKIMVSKSMDTGKLQLIWFLEPKSDKGISFLKIQNNDGINQMKIWLPAFKKTRRIAANKKEDSFMGSDLSYSDLMIRKKDEYNYMLIDHILFEKDSCYIIEVSPKVNNSIYKKYNLWLLKKTFRVKKEDLYDFNDILIKTKKYKYIEVKGFNILKEIEVHNFEKDHKTKVVFSDIKIDTGLETTFFHERNLKRIPPF